MDALPRSLAVMERSDIELAGIISQAVTDSMYRQNEIWYLRCPRKGLISNGSSSYAHLSRVHSTEVRRLAQAVAFFPYWRAMLNAYPGINCTLQSFDGVSGNPIPFCEEYYDLGLDCISEFGRVYKLPPPVVVGAIGQMAPTGSRCRECGGRDGTHDDECSRKPRPQVEEFPLTEIDDDPIAPHTYCPECGCILGEQPHRYGCRDYTPPL